jgi:hypothetical protein
MRRETPIRRSVDGGKIRRATDAVNGVAAVAVGGMTGADSTPTPPSRTPRTTCALAREILRDVARKSS